MSQTSLPIHRLPLPSRTLQSSLTQLELDPSPISQRRSTTFKPSTAGIWARVNPLWTSWPLRLTKEEVLEMGVDVDKGDQVSVSDVLKRWDPVEMVGDGNEEKGGGGGGEVESDRRRTSKHRQKLEAHLLGVVPQVLDTELPHLDAGDAVSISSGQEESASSSRDQLIDVLSGKHVISHDSYGTWSTRYCGHQFGVWAGQLGDGRAISILETESPKGGRQEIQLKGAGRTPFSRHADGLAVLRSGVREYLGCEAVAALGIPTTRSLALLTAEDLPVIRETGPEPCSLTARIAPSFIRIGHFQALNPGEEGRNTRQIFLGGGYLTQSGETDGPLRGQGNIEGLKQLTEWCMYITQEQGWGGKGVGVKAWFEEVVRRNAEMVAGWQVYGFCHGVINTDNVSVLGLTIDYGPYAFMDVFDEAHICNHSDPSGLYNYRNQPSRILFALDKLHQALAPLIGHEIATSTTSPSSTPALDNSISPETIDELTDIAMTETQGWEDRFWTLERQYEQEGWNKRFGLKTVERDDIREIRRAFLNHLHAFGLDMGSAFRRLGYFDVAKAVADGTSSLGAGQNEKDKVVDQGYTETFVRDFIQRSKPTSSTNTSRTTDPAELSTNHTKIDDAAAASPVLVQWFTQYAERVMLETEQAAWREQVQVGSNSANGNESSTGEGDWLVKRKKSMLGTNPRFILRQWVLEELIAQMDEGLGMGDEQGRRLARTKLSNILKMTTEPFKAYGEDLPLNPEACPTPEAAEQQRLCGLGSKDMLGFQCSCSS